ncbi:hypothetical protein ABK040_010409 [Willaertia magna]
MSFFKLHVTTKSKNNNGFSENMIQSEQTVTTNPTMSTIVNETVINTSPTSPNKRSGTIRRQALHNGSIIQFSKHHHQQETLEEYLKFFQLNEVSKEFNNENSSSFDVFGNRSLNGKLILLSDEKEIHLSFFPFSVSQLECNNEALCHSEWKLTLTNDQLKNVISSQPGAHGFQFLNVKHLFHFIRNSIAEEANFEENKGEKMDFKIVLSNQKISTEKDIDICQVISDEDNFDLNESRISVENQRNNYIPPLNQLIFLHLSYESVKLGISIQFKLPLIPKVNDSDNTSKYFENYHFLLNHIILKYKEKNEELTKLFNTFDKRFIKQEKVLLSSDCKTISMKVEGWATCITKNQILFKEKNKLSIKLESLSSLYIFIGCIGLDEEVNILQISNQFVGHSSQDNHSFSYFLKENQFRRGTRVCQGKIHSNVPQNKIDESASSSSLFLWNEGDTLTLYIKKNKWFVVKNDGEAIIIPEENIIEEVDESKDWYFAVSLQQEGQQISIF